MGVLEDAIREHLELKRKHGASDEELEQQQEEALGPARREFEPPAEEASEGELAEAEAEPAEPAGEDEAPIEPEPELEDEAPTDAEPEPPEPSVSEGPTQVYERPVPEPPPDEVDFADEGDEDDRLWSDQRPPRDLDFD
jgi:hypothetical protein